MNLFTAFSRKPEPEPFSYTPLPHDRAIRLLHLVPDRTQHHGFSLVLQAADLDNAPKFCALSYTWQRAVVKTPAELEPDYREAPALVSVLCNGKRLEITENAFDFLCRIFSCGQFRADKTQVGANHVWIDSICINQSDARDRSHQVSLMGDIYFKCGGTIVWLGKEEPDPGTRWVVESFIPNFMELYRRRGVGMLRTKGPLCSDAEIGAELGEDVCGGWRKHYLHFFMFLARRRWFSRGWVAQEVILKAIFKNNLVLVVCGMSCFSVAWAVLNDFLQALMTLSWSRPLADRLCLQSSTRPWHVPLTRLFQNAHSLNRLGQLVLDNWDGSKTSAILEHRHEPTTDMERAYSLLYEFVNRMRDRYFADRRDHIYGCYGLVARTLKPDVSDHPLSPDYNLGDAELYIRTTWTLVQNMARLNILNYVEPPSQNRFAELPSWVPNFSRIHLARLIEMGRTNGQKIDASQRRTPHSAIRLTNQNELVLRGARLTTVSQKGPRLTRKRTSNMDWFLRLLSEHGHYHPTNEPSEEALSRTILANYFYWDTPNQTHIDEFREWWTVALTCRIKRLEGNLQGSSVALTGALKSLGKRSAWFPSMDEVTEALKIDPGNRDRTSPAYAVEVAYLRLVWPTRVFFVSSGGHFCFATDDVEPDDEVWLLEGGKTPFVLRPRAEGGYQLVGDAYVHGVMYGEAMTPGFVEGFGPVTIV
ncbi:heterokaryon incompatibility protein-domain-containing protein [Podospora aff. communis PSN243]|uniref:Heterokaryon incompatibility protein-domain-containing protein n=1 Tax=Podospora aff. communis PSN243 TaxID=3040156 RepID=A0AAV9G965_9PEZI|nr:heterokaryon incompatibility protein-domain-containing protein [Podospora aff. communis PSN243]